MGLSATPQHRELSQVFRAIVKGPSPQWLIDNRFLSPFRYFQCTQGDLSKLVRDGDDYREASVAAAMQDLGGDLVRDWKRHATGRATVGFFPRRSHAQEAVELLTKAGIRARYVDGETPDDERRAMFRDLNDGRIDYIANVGVVERGTDIPRVGCVQMCTAVGNVVRRHGFFEDNVEWSLDWNERPAQTHDARATIKCPSCDAGYRGGQCRQCGYEPTKRERQSQGLEFVGGELVEVQRKPRESESTQSNEQLLVTALFQAGRSGKTFGQACMFARRAAERQGTAFTMPASFQIGGRRFRPVSPGDRDVKRLVRDIYGVTVGNYSEFKNPYRIK